MKACKSVSTIIACLQRPVLMYYCNAGFSDAGQEFQLSDPEDKSSYFGASGQRDTVVNPCLNSTYRFVERIISHLISLHKVT